MELDITQTSTVDLKSLVPDFSVQNQILDGPTDIKETFWMDEEWTKKVGYWKTIPEFNRPITALSVWTAGKGFTTQPNFQVILDKIIGWGEDSFTSIMQNLIKTKKFAGDSYAEIIRNKETATLINLKVLNNGRMRHVVNQQGIIIGYDYRQVDGKFKRFKPEEILHLCNDRIGDEIHGTGIYELVKWVLDAKHEAMNDKRRQLHLSTIRVMEVAEDDKPRMANLRRDFAEAIKNGSVLLVPEGFGKLQDLVPPTTEHIAWTTYLENFVYQAIGVPRVIATSENFTESGGKIGFLTFEPIYTNEQVQLEADLWNQLAIRVKFNRPPSLDNNLNQDQAKDGPLTATQPNDTIAGRGE